MNFKETLSVINQMQADGVIKQYAVGGAVGANFYLEVSDTEDVDVFVALELSPGQSLLNLSSIYDYLRLRGYRTEGEYVIIGDWPVQFLVPDGPLVEEALKAATIKDLDGIPVRVFTAEHLMAIAVKLGRPDDKPRLVRFLATSGSQESRSSFDERALNGILQRHGLMDRWTQLRKAIAG